jgi:hypothetical protein
METIPIRKINSDFIINFVKDVLNLELPKQEYNLLRLTILIGKIIIALYYIKKYSSIRSLDEMKEIYMKSQWYNIANNIAVMLIILFF